MLALASVAVLSLRASAAKQEQMLSSYSVEVLEASRLELTAEEMVSAARGFLLTGDSARLDGAREISATFERELQALLSQAQSGEERRRLARVRAMADAHSGAFARMLARGAVGSGAAAPGSSALLEPLFSTRDELKARLEGFVAYKQAMMAEARTLAQHERERATATILGFGALGIVVCGLLAWLTTTRLGRLYQQERLATRHAEEATAARNQLLAVVAHDLRSPLSAMVMQAALIRRTTPDPGAGRHARSIEEIAMRMESLIKNLLDTVAIEAGGLSVSPSRTALGPLVAGCVQMFAMLGARKSIRVEQQVEPEDLEALCDGQRLSQLLSNLISNALDFTAEGGQVTVRAFREGEHVRLEVQDTGCGIRPEHVPRLFERYWKADVGGRKGGGLGLFIAKAIVEAHGGRIWVDSKVGAGSTFLCELPLAPSAPEMVRAPVAGPTPLSVETPSPIRA
jgi:signal transduction histidine kinase